MPIEDKIADTDTVGFTFKQLEFKQLGSTLAILSVTQLGSKIFPVA